MGESAAPAEAPTQRLDSDNNPRLDTGAKKAPRRLRPQIVEEDSVESYALDRRVDMPPSMGKVGRFELRRFLGQGAFGKVYLAHDPDLDRAVAIKVPRRPPTDQRGVKRFLAEATSAARLRHPNIVAIYEAGVAGETIFIASEFVEGMPLSIRMSERPPGTTQAVRWVRDLARGLQYAHEHGVIHRDIKPANVMIGRDERPQLMDFGLALRRDAGEHSRIDGVVGTPAYMSPEQARGENTEVGPKSDQFALGIVLYELLTGVTPFRGGVTEIHKQITDPIFRPPPPHRLKPEIPSGLSAVCMKALAKRPSDRYRCAGDFAADLDRFLKGKKALAGKPPRGSGEPGFFRRARRWLRKNPRRAALAVVAMALLTGVVAGGWWVRSRVRDAEQKLEAARRMEKEHNADLFRERGARLGSQGKAAEGIVLLARSFEIARELGDPNRARAAVDAFGDNAWELPAPMGMTGSRAINWRLAGSLTLGIPVGDLGDGERIEHAGLAKYTGYGSAGTKVLTSPGRPKGAKEAPLELFDARTNKPFARLPYSEMLVFSPDGRRVYYGAKLTWGIWDSERNQLLGPEHSRDQHPGTAAFNHDGSRLLYYGGDGSAAVSEVWDTIEMRRLSQDPTNWIRDIWGRTNLPVALSPDGTQIVGLIGRQVLFWKAGEKIDRENAINKPRVSGSELTAAAYSLDGTRVYFGAEKSTEAWTPSGERIGEWLPGSRVRQIVFSPDGRQVALVGSEGVQVWDTDSRRPVGPPRHRGATRAQFRPDGRELLTASDREVRLWPHPVVPEAERGQAARLWAEATTGLEVADNGEFRPLSDEERADRYARFAGLAGLSVN